MKNIYIAAILMIIYYYNKAFQPFSDIDGL